MGYTEVPNSVRTILILLTTLSFLPQLHRLRSRKCSLGLSPSYVLCNLIFATEQLTNIFYMMVNYPEARWDDFVHDPVTAGDWLNFAQMAITWGLFLVLFILTIHYRPPQRRKCEYVNLYTFYLCISLIPEVIDIVDLTPVLSTPSWSTDHLVGAFVSMHGLLLNTLAPFFSLISILPQTAQIWKHIRKKEYDCLSLLGLAVQAVVFAFVAASWPWRISYTDVDYGKFAPGWFWESGWPVVENGVFAGVQGVLLLVAVWRRLVQRREGGKRDEEREREPLLQSR
ncbi:hypothetical protein BJX61DRAFT_214425 [Aspergillus egyptiacus]|nr:hypothetical protein BJX61DRAFT_214425 [Aspergillus egyptiacus]